MLCEICELAEAIQKHHVKYFPEETVPVCDRCHKLIHSGLYPFLTTKYIKYTKGDAKLFYEQKGKIDKFLSYLSRKRRRK